VIWLEKPTGEEENSHRADYIPAEGASAAGKSKFTEAMIYADTLRLVPSAVQRNHLRFKSPATSGFFGLYK
jgi:hypothetical protein